MHRLLCMYICCIEWEPRGNPPKRHGATRIHADAAWKIFNGNPNRRPIKSCKETVSYWNFDQLTEENASPNRQSAHIAGSADATDLKSHWSSDTPTWLMRSRNDGCFRISHPIITQVIATHALSEFATTPISLMRHTAITIVRPIKINANPTTHPLQPSKSKTRPFKSEPDPQRTSTAVRRCKSTLHLMISTFK